MMATKTCADVATKNAGTREPRPYWSWVDRDNRGDRDDRGRPATTANGRGNNKDKKPRPYRRRDVDAENR